MAHMTNLFFDDKELRHPMASGSPKGFREDFRVGAVPALSSKNVRASNMNALTVQKQELNDVLTQMEEIGASLLIEGQLLKIMSERTELVSVFRETYRKWPVSYKIRFLREKVVDRFRVRGGRVVLIG